MNMKVLQKKSPSLNWFKKNRQLKNQQVPDEVYCSFDQSLDSSHDDNKKNVDYVFLALREQATQLTRTEPYMTTLLKQSILHPQCSTFSNVISRAIAVRLVSSCGNNPIMGTDEVTEIIEQAMNSQDLEYGDTMSDAVCRDILACLRRDPACETELEVVLFYKGFAALVCHRAARRHYGDRTRTPEYGRTNVNSKEGRFVSLWLQSQASAAFGVDIHPAAEIGSGTFFDHATGLVICETAKVGNNCTILHGVTLGGTGKEGGDRHPKVGNDVLIGAGSSILGNIRVGDGAKIGAGTVVLKPIPNGATVVGKPAKIVGWAAEKRPGSVVDNSLTKVIVVEDDRINKNDGFGNFSTRTSSTEWSFSSDDESNAPINEMRNQWENTLV